MTTIDIDNLTNSEIMKLAKKLHKQWAINNMFCDGAQQPDADDYFYYNGIRSCYLGCVGSPDYFITEVGDVYRERRNGKVSLLKQIFVNGKWNVNTSTNCIVKRYIVHKLVAKCFVPNPKGYKSVGFVDGDVNNLKASNLEWKERADT